MPPGVPRLPPAGGYYASPALAALLRTVPADELGARFPGTMTGTIGPAGLHGAGDLPSISGADLPARRGAAGHAEAPVVLAADRARDRRRVYVYGLDKTSRNTIGVAAYPGLLLTMIGIVIAGPWLTAQAARLFGRLAGGSSALLAARRLADNPKRAYRAVAGLTLAVFLGTMVGLIVPAVNSTDETPAAGALSNILVGRVELPAAAGQHLIGGVSAIPGAAVYPLYNLLTQAEEALGPTLVAVSCANLRAMPALGRCAPGVRAVQVMDNSLFDDNPRYSDKPIVDATSPAYTGNLTTLPVQTVLVTVNSPATLERVRTYLAVHAPPRVGGNPGDSPTPPRTFGETLQIRTARAATFEKILYAAVALTLIVAGCSLAVTVGGGLVDRKRPFTLLRVSGTPVGVLSRVVLLEAAVPLVAATVVAAGIAYGTSVMAVLRLAPAGTAIPQLGRDYYTIMGIGLAGAFGVITLTLPLLRTMTAPSTIRFE